MHDTGNYSNDLAELFSISWLIVYRTLARQLGGTVAKAA